MGKEAPQIFRLERAAFVRDKGPSENGKYGAKLTPPRTDFSVTNGISFNHYIVSIVFLQRHDKILKHVQYRRLGMGLTLVSKNREKIDPNNPHESALG